MDKIIRLSKEVKFAGVGNDEKQEKFYNALIKEMGNCIRDQKLEREPFKIHKSKNSAVYQKLTNEINQYALELFKSNQGYEEFIFGRHGFSVPLEFDHLRIDMYDFHKSAFFYFYFKSNELYLVDTIADYLVLKLDKGTNETFVVSLDNYEISIIEHFQKWICLT